MQTPQSDLRNLDGLGQSLPLVLVPIRCGEHEVFKAAARIMWPFPFLFKLEDPHLKITTQKLKMA